MSGIEYNLGFRKKVAVDLCESGFRLFIESGRNSELTCIPLSMIERTTLSI